MITPSFDKWYDSLSDEDYQALMEEYYGDMEKAYNDEVYNDKVYNDKVSEWMNILWRRDVRRKLMKTMTKLILAILFMLIVISFYGLAEAKEPQSSMWARCVNDKAVVSCKLVDDKIFINGKEANVTKLDVVVIDNVVNVLIKDK